MGGGGRCPVGGQGRAESRTVCFSQGWRDHTALGEDPGSLPITCVGQLIAALSVALRDRVTFSALCERTRMRTHTHPHHAHTLIYTLVYTHTHT